MPAGFKSWLREFLLKLNKETDVDVFVDYISGVMEDGAESKTELLNSLQEILEAIINNDVQSHCATIIEQFEQFSSGKHAKPAAGLAAAADGVSTSDTRAGQEETLEEQMKRLMKLDETKLISRPIRRRQPDQENEEDDGDAYHGFGDVSTTDDEEDLDDYGYTNAADQQHAIDKPGTIDDVLRELGTSGLGGSAARSNGGRTGAAAATGGGNHAQAASGKSTAVIGVLDSSGDEQQDSAILGMSGKANREAASQAERTERERLRSEHAKRREQNRADKERQREQQKQRKESERKRTQKAERKR